MTPTSDWKRASRKFFTAASTMSRAACGSDHSSFTVTVVASTQTFMRCSILPTSASNFSSSVGSGLPSLRLILSIKRRCG